MSAPLTKEDVKEAVTEVFETFGFDLERKSRIRSNMEFLDRLHGSAETVGDAGKKAAATTLVTGLLGLVWLGLGDKIRGLFH